MNKFTEWFPAEIKPVHNGVYQTAICPPEFLNGPYQKYENGVWFSTGDTVEEAADCPFESAIASHITHWRGLTEPSA
jgi:hypothetical protein